MRISLVQMEILLVQAHEVQNFSFGCNTGIKRKHSLLKKFTIVNNLKNHCDMQICTATNVIWIDVYINIGPIVRMVCSFELLWSKASNRLQWEQNLQNALFSVINWTYPVNKFKSSNLIHVYLLVWSPLKWNRRICRNLFKPKQDHIFLWNFVNIR
jgi:hypothetical protein